MITLGVDGRFANYPQRAGVGSYSLGLIHALAEGVPEDFLLRVYLDAPPNAHFQLNPARTEIRILPRAPLWTHRALRNELRRHPPSVFFTPMTNLPLFPPCSSIVAVHDLAFLDFPEEFTFRRRFQARLQTRHAIAAAAHLVADSKATAEAIRRHFGGKTPEISVLYSGVHLAHSVADQAIPATPYVLYIGRLQPRKNLVRLIDAFAQARAEAHLPHQLLLAGSRGWMYKEILKTAEAHGEYVKLLGYVPDDQLTNLLAHADCLALVSLWEGFGLPPLEAMASGTPVVCSNVSSMPEVVGESGVLVDPYSVDSIKNGLLEVLCNPERKQELTQSGLERAKQFTWAKAAAQLFDLARAKAKA